MLFDCLSKSWFAGEAVAREANSTDVVKRVLVIMAAREKRCKEVVGGMKVFAERVKGR